MSESEITFDLRSLERLEQHLRGLDIEPQRQLLEALGGEVEDQVVSRLEAGGPAPNDEPWPAWSPRYAATRGGGKSLLRDEGEQLTSIQYLVTGDDALVIGSNLEYAATHQYGDDDRSIPARPYLGLSPDDEQSVEAVALKWLRDRVMAA